MKIRYVGKDGIGGIFKRGEVYDRFMLAGPIYIHVTVYVDVKPYTCWFRSREAAEKWFEIV